MRLLYLVVTADVRAAMFPEQRSAQESVGMTNSSMISGSKRRSPVGYRTDGIRPESAQRRKVSGWIPMRAAASATLRGLDGLCMRSMYPWTTLTAIDTPKIGLRFGNIFGGTRHEGHRLAETYLCVPNMWP